MSIDVRLAPDGYYFAHGKLRAIFPVPPLTDVRNAAHVEENSRISTPPPSPPSDLSLTVMDQGSQTSTNDLLGNTGIPFDPSSQVFDQRWERSDDGETGWTIVAGTETFDGSSGPYTYVSDDNGKFFRFFVSIVNDQGSSQTVSNVIGPVTFTP
jgi:hypothetical protein